MFIGKFGADKIFKSKDSSITDDDIDMILNAGKQKTQELNDKLDMVKAVEEANLEAEKSKHLKTKVRDEKKLSKKDKLLKKSY